MKMVKPMKSMCRQSLTDLVIFLKFQRKYFHCVVSSESGTDCCGCRIDHEFFQKAKNNFQCIIWILQNLIKGKIRLLEQNLEPLCTTPTAGYTVKTFPLGLQQNHQTCQASSIFSLHCLPHLPFSPCHLFTCSLGQSPCVLTPYVLEKTPLLGVLFLGYFL